ncbi:MAG TPA: hypothetical protein PKZ99_09875 [Azospirillaceae bacterium]|nr:hypothetical protein [Azospirillaceae bacterium]
MIPDLPAAAADLRVGERFITRRYGEVEVVGVGLDDAPSIQFRAVASPGRPADFVYLIAAAAFIAALQRRA